ncbi:MAG: hypothetical protein WA726_07870 [Acidimicrobiia bacterium]
MALLLEALVELSEEGEALESGLAFSDFSDFSDLEDEAALAGEDLESVA